MTSTLSGSGTGPPDPAPAGPRAGTSPPRRVSRVVGALGPAVLVAAVALVCRLVPLLRGGGLFGLGSYDDGVHMAAALAWVHGATPYRDFLFLQPPGVLVALAPFATLGALTHEGLGFAAARLAWVAMGAANAVLVTRIARPLGAWPALLGGLFYAVWWPAVYVERTTMLEGLGNVTLLLALLALARADRVSSGHRSWSGWPLLAGLALGFGAGVKIWGVLAALLVAVWQLAPERRRRLPGLLAGFTAAGALVYLPFFVAAPRAMWHQVVTVQLGRSGEPSTVWHRLTLIGGLEPWRPAHPVLAGVVLLAVVALTLAAGVPTARLPVLLALAYGLLLFALTPNLFRQYPAVLAGPAALVVAAAAARLLGLRCRVPRRGRGPRAAAGVLLVVAVLALGLPGLGQRLGTRFPAAALAPVVRTLPGCLTSDEPTVLIELDQVGRTVERGCRVVVDYGGYAYDPPPALTVGPHGPRTPRQLRRIRDTAGWQADLRAYLATGSGAFHVRNRGSGPAAARSWAVWTSWPVLARHGDVVLRRPPR
ncbi:hypothetical protein FHX74_003418 [Friedmanniella endophytica]|uniref:4-amino-4-deoxy-L-arabinose transferase n=1 Tax=Microlunatus kandeliicorticis TaxID=1759536 RepID=A0A7W3P7A7_9ACTN|nr:hypothetical protein [Microlunatus kandeliicorticis]MBA8795777.1 hypothetical protein [Microlunatus kandeliicorticis]